LMLMEGADPSRTPEDLAQFVDWGVRIIGPAWHATRFAGGTGEPGPLTDAGRDLLRAMDAHGLALDVSHLAEEAFWQALEIFHGPVIASHVCCRALTPTDRQLSDAMLRAIAARGGVVGLIFYNRFINARWLAADGKEAVSLDDLRRHADHMLNIMGPHGLALGTDLDGGVGRDDIPREMDSVEDLHRFANTLAQAGYDASAIAGIMGGNWLRVMQGLLAA